MKSIWHHGLSGDDLGHRTLRDTTRYLLQQVCPESIVFRDVDAERDVYTREWIEQLNAQADLLLIGGGALFRHADTESGWLFRGGLAALARIRVPIVVYGVGCDRTPYTRESQSDRINEHLRELQRRTCLFSVRDGGSREELVSRGLRWSRIQVVPDTTVFSPSEPLPRHEFLDRSGPLIGVNLAGDHPELRFPAPVAENEKAAMEALAQGLARCCDELGARVLLLPHRPEADERFDSLLRKTIGIQRVRTLSELCPTAYSAAGSATRLLSAAYGRCQLVLGMSRSACQLALGQRRRFLPVGENRKHRFLLEELGFGGDALAGRVLPDPRDAARRVVELSRRILEDETWELRVARALERQRLGLERWNRLVAGALSSYRRPA